MHCGDATCFAGNTFSVVDDDGDTGFWATMALDSAGLPVIAYYDRGRADLKVARCGDVDCSAGNIIIVDGEGEVGGDCSLTLDAAGYPVISYRDATNDTLKVAALVG